MKEELIIEEFYKMFDVLINGNGDKINLLRENKVSHKSITIAVVNLIEKLNGEKVERKQETLQEYLNKPKNNFIIKGETTSDYN